MRDSVELPTKKVKVDSKMSEDFNKVTEKVKGKKLKSSVVDLNSEQLLNTPTVEEMNTYKETPSTMSKVEPKQTLTEEDNMLLETVFKIARQFVVNTSGEINDEEVLMRMSSLKNKIKTL
jgi:hypothetical protein